MHATLLCLNLFLLRIYLITVFPAMWTTQIMLFYMLQMSGLNLSVECFQYLRVKPPPFFSRGLTLTFQVVFLSLS